MSTHTLTFKQKSLRLSPMYLFFFTLWGVFLPYLGRFLLAQGLSEQEVSIIAAVVTGVNMFAPFMFSYFSDMLGRRMIFIRAGYVISGVMYAATLYGEGFWYFLTVFGLLATFLSAVLPQMEAIALDVLGSEKSRYGQVRLWGSAGFVIIVWLLGILLTTYSVRILPIIGCSLTVLMFASTFFIKEKPRKTKEQQAEDATSNSAFKVDWWQVVVLLLVLIFWQFGMAPYNTFFDIYLQQFGYPASTIGFLMSFGALCEIAVFFFIASFFRRFSERSLMTVALALTVIRWLMTYALPESFIALVFAQTLHAATFGVVHSVAIHRIGHLFPDSKAGLGQGLYVAIGTGFGLSVGNVLAGLIWTGSGVVFIQGAIWAVLATLLTWFGFKDNERAK
ncbi:MFS transporter [Reinekea forsetii]|nr:MFS transporter [Reinekea forsetii]